MQPSIWSEFKKYLGDALPGGALNPELTTNINESPVPVSMAALRSFMGEAPHELGVSVLHPRYKDIMGAAEPAFWAGLATQAAPVLSGLSALKASRGTALSAAPRNVEGALSRQAGVFVGPKSKTWDAAAAQRAAEMETAGIDPRNIWRETGTWRGPEGILRQEIDDSLARYRPGAIAAQIGSRDEIMAPMHMVLEHPNLYDAVGPLRHYGWNVSSSKVPEGGAYYSNKFGNVVLHPESAYGLESGKSTTLHELQHAIQAREGFGRGGNPGMFPTPLINDAKTIAGELGQGTDRMTINRWFKSTYGRSPDPAAWDLAEHPMIDRMVADDPVENYARLAGEAEARAVQARMKMTPEERRATYPAESFDRPIDQLIIYSDDSPMYSLPGIEKYYRASTSGSIRPGMFLTPDENAARQFARQFDLPNVSEFSVRPRSSGDESDVERIAKALGIHEPGVPVDQYLMQGPDAVYVEAPQVLEELMNSGLDSLLLDDGMSKLKSLYVLDPSIVRKVGPVSGYARGGLAQLKGCSCGR